MQSLNFHKLALLLIVLCAGRFYLIVTLIIVLFQICKYMPASLIVTFFDLTYNVSYICHWNIIVLPAPDLSTPEEDTISYQSLMIIDLTLDIKRHLPLRLGRFLTNHLHGIITWINWQYFFKIAQVACQISIAVKKYTANVLNNG